MKKNQIKYVTFALLLLQYSSLICSTTALVLEQNAMFLKSAQNNLISFFSQATSDANDLSVAQNNSRVGVISNQWASNNASAQQNGLQVSTKFYNVTSQTMTVQPLIDKIASGSPVTITYNKNNPSYYNFDTVATTIRADQKLSYRISVVDRANSAVVDYDPVNAPAGYQINASATTISAIGLEKPYEWETNKSQVSTKFYNVSSETMSVQALIDKVPSGVPVIITYNKSNPSYYNSGTVTTAITPIQKLTYIISVAGRVNSDTAEYDPVNAPAGYQINATNTTVSAYPLKKPYDWETTTPTPTQTPAPTPTPAAPAAPAAPVVPGPINIKVINLNKGIDKAVKRTELVPFVAYMLPNGNGNSAQGAIDGKNTYVFHPDGVYEIVTRIPASGGQRGVDRVLYSRLQSEFIGKTTWDAATNTVS